MVEVGEEVGRTGVTVYLYTVEVVVKKVEGANLALEEILRRFGGLVKLDDWHTHLRLVTALHHDLAVVFCETHLQEGMGIDGCDEGRLQTGYVYMV